MAKARTPEKTTSKKAEEKKPAPRASERPKASTKSSAGTEKAEKVVAKAPVKQTAAEKAASDAAFAKHGTMANQKSVPDPSEVKAHPDAKISKQELLHLYNLLIAKRNSVLDGRDQHVNEALNDTDGLADEIDIAQRSTDQAFLFRYADKERKVLIAIEGALEKMRSGEYGLCEGTDEPIGYRRLEASPWTRYSVEYKERLEREEAQHVR
jgi:DnaK suppressor protein